MMKRLPGRFMMVLTAVIAGIPLFLSKQLEALRAGSMVARQSSSFARGIALLSIVVAAGAVRAGDLRREVDVLRQGDRTDRGSMMLDNLERRAREALAAIPRSRT